MKLKPREFHETVSKILTEKLKPMLQEKVNLATCLSIYNTIFETFADIIKEAQLPLSNESVNYIAQQYYDGVVINQNEFLDPHIFTQRATLHNIETKELVLLSAMLFGTDFALPVLHEIKRRN